MVHGFLAEGGRIGLWAETTDPDPAGTVRTLRVRPGRASVRPRRRRSAGEPGTVMLTLPRGRSGPLASPECDPVGGRRAVAGPGRLAGAHRAPSTRAFDPDWLARGRRAGPPPERRSGSWPTWSGSRGAWSSAGPGGADDHLGCRPTYGLLLAAGCRRAVTRPRCEGHGSTSQPAGGHRSGRGQPGRVPPGERRCTGTDTVDGAARPGGAAGWPPSPARAHLHRGPPARSALRLTLDRWQASGAPARYGPASGCPMWRKARTDDEPAGWLLEFLLQPVADPSVLVPAEHVWAEVGRAAARVGRRPAGGAAGRPRPGQPAATRTSTTRCTSRDRPSCSSTPPARTGSCTHAPLLAEAGFGVLLPARWQRRTAARPDPDGPHPTDDDRGAAGPDGQPGRDRRLPVGPGAGAEFLSEADLIELARAKVPLVRLRGRWVYLDADQLGRARVPGPRRLGADDAPARRCGWSGCSRTASSRCR